MKKFTKSILFSFSLVLFGFAVHAQGIMDGFNKGKANLDVSLSYTYESYDKFYIGDQKKDLSVTGLQKLNKNDFNLYAAYGVTDKFDLIINLPYISAASNQVNGDPRVKEDNFQDISLFGKYRLLESKSKSGKLSLMGGLGVSLPLSNYLTNVIYAIGNHSASAGTKLDLKYTFNSGLFISGQTGYDFRFKSEVPDLVGLGAKIGYASKNIYVDGYFQQDLSTSGIDIGGPGFTPARFPETKVNRSLFGVNVYFPIQPAFGISVNGGGVVSGRNAGLPYFFGAGLNFKFKTK